MTLLASELLRLAKPFIEDGVHPQIIVRVRAQPPAILARPTAEDCLGSGFRVWQYSALLPRVLRATHTARGQQSFVPRCLLTRMPVHLLYTRPSLTRGTARRRRSRSSG